MFQDLDAMSCALHRLLGIRRRCGPGGKPTTSADAWLCASPTCVVQLVPQALEETLSKHTPLHPPGHMSPGECGLDCAPRSQSLVSFFWGTMLSSAPAAYPLAFGTSLLTEI